jgi:uncharacterized membrane protein
MVLRTAYLLRTYWLWFAILAAGLLTFLVAPGGVAEKSRTVLHGLCAQTPTHSFAFGDQLLPFDGRMTGIYGGTFVTLAVLALRGRLFAYGNPPRRVIAVLALGVALMAVDGVNSLFLDLGLWHPYQPRNEIRLITGYAAGVALAIVLAWLLASSVYRVGQNEPVVGEVQELAPMLIGFVPYAAVVLSGLSWLYTPLAMLLMVSAWLTMSLLALVVVVLTFRLDERVERISRLHVPGAVAAIVGLLLMLLLASGRIWLEAAMGIPSTL